MAHSKLGNKKKACEKYKLSGHREENKMKRQKRNEKRIEHFNKRREDGKTYHYNKAHVQEKLDGEYGSRKNYNPVLKIWYSNTNSNKGKYGDFCKWRRVFNKLDYQIEKEKAEEKRLAQVTEKRM